MVITRFRKRVRSTPFRRTVRRRLNFGRRRRFRRVRRFSGLTNRNSGPISIGRFRARRQSRAQWRRWLWMSTQQKSHYRSVSAGSLILNTPGGQSDATLSIITPGDVFWTTAGGALPEDEGVTLPTFSGDIILRGGVSRVSITNRHFGVDAADNIRVTVFTVWTAKTVPGFTFPTTVPISWDPSVFRDFQRHGRVIGKREAILKNDGESVELFYRHRIQRIDQGVFTRGGSRLQYFVLVSQLGNTDLGIAEVCDVSVSINYSFAADAV